MIMICRKKRGFLTGRINFLLVSNELSGTELDLDGKQTSESQHGCRRRRVDVVSVHVVCTVQ